MTVLQILSTLSLLCLVQADFFITETVVARENASNICSLATPGIHYSDKGITVEVNNSYIKDGDKLWVGYVAEFNTFLYIGCFHPDGLLDNTTTEKHIGQCASFCKSPFIGMQIHKCYCIYSQSTDIRGATCTSECDKPFKFLCGNDKDDENGKGVSVYMSVADTTDSKLNGHYCQVVQRNSTASGITWNYDWKTCDTKCKTICQNESSQQYNDENWRDSMNTCQEKDQQLSEIISGSFENIGPERCGWTEKIRSLVIKKTGDISLANQPMVQQGYIKRKGGQVYLKFKTSNKKKLYSALCTRGQTTPQQTSEGDNSSLVAVVVVITLLVLIALVVGVILIWRRRKHSLVKKDDSALSQENDHSNPRSRNALLNESHQDGDDRHDYFIIEPVNEYAEIKDVDVTAATNDEYDTATNLPKKSNDTDNVYNKLEDLTDDPYNHTITTAAIVENKMSNQTSNDTDNVYNKLEDLADDTYNHTNTTAVSVEETYDKATPNDQESTYNTANALPGSGIDNDKVTDSEINTLESSGGT